MTPELKEKTILETIWKLLKEHDVTFDGAVRIAVRLILSCAHNSDAASETFDYAVRLLTRSIARKGAEKPNAHQTPSTGATDSTMRKTDLQALAEQLQRMGDDANHVRLQHLDPRPGQVRADTRIRAIYASAANAYFNAARMVQSLLKSD